MASLVKNPALCRPAGVFVYPTFGRSQAAPFPSQIPTVCPLCGAKAHGVWHPGTRRWSFGAHRRGGAPA